MTGHSIYFRSAGAVTAAGTGVPALCRAAADADWQPSLGIDHPNGAPLAVAACGEFSTKGLISPVIVRRLDRPARLLAVAVQEALKGVGDPLPWDRSRIGLTNATWNAGTSAIMEVLQFVFLGNPDEAPPAQFPSTVTNAAASQVGIIEKLGGPNITLVEKQVGGLRAIIEAAGLFRRSRADAVVACAVDEAIWINAEGYRRIGTLRHGNHPGQVLGEGAIALSLAPEPGPAPLARLAGWASTSSQALPWCYPSDASALIRASREALGMAGLQANQIDAICTLANGIPALDKLELDMVRTAFGDHRPAVINLGRFGEGAFASALRVLGAVHAVCGRLESQWNVPAHLASQHFPPLTRRPRHILVPGLAGGGSAIAVVISAV